MNLKTSSKMKKFKVMIYVYSTKPTKSGMTTPRSAGLSQSGSKRPGKFSWSCRTKNVVYYINKQFWELGTLLRDLVFKYSKESIIMIFHYRSSVPIWPWHRYWNRHSPEERGGPRQRRRGLFWVLWIICFILLFH